MAAKAAARPLLFPAGPLPWLKPAIFAGSAAPLVVLGVRASRGGLGTEPVSEALNQLGLLALVFLVASLACTPLKTIAGATWPIRVRKMLGLYALFYASLHFLVYALVDHFLDLSAILEDITKRPFIIVGLSALVLLVPLGITSTARMVKRLGFARWKMLHRLAYVAGVLGVVHFVLRVKKDVTEPAIYGAALGFFFAVRLGAWMQERRAAAKKGLQVE